jgi:hypothetical protein
MISDVNCLREQFSDTVDTTFILGRFKLKQVLIDRCEISSSYIIPTANKTEVL